MLECGDNICGVACWEYDTFHRIPSDAKIRRKDMQCNLGGKQHTFIGRLVIVGLVTFCVSMALCARCILHETNCTAEAQNTDRTGLNQTAPAVLSPQRAETGAIHASY